LIVIRRFAYGLTITTKNFVRAKAFSF